MNDRKPILCLDFDGVIHSYSSGWQGAGIVSDPPVSGAIEFIYAAQREFRIAIFSSRSGQPGGLDAMRGWLLSFMLVSDADPREARLVYDAIEWSTEKPPAVVTIDDRALTFDGTWPSIASLKTFQPWNKKAASDQPKDIWGGSRTFVRVYRLPSQLTSGYCFGRGVPITFQNVDWFETMDDHGQSALTDFIRTKNYYDPTARFLVLGDKPEFTYTIEPATPQAQP